MFLVLVAILCLITFQCKCENLFVRPGGTGSHTGLDWNNAWSSDNTFANWGNGQGKIGSGDTVWFAGGRYNGPINILGNGTPTDRIFFKRAVTSDSACTSAQGWDSSFDSQVQITCGPPVAPVGFEVQSPNGNYVTIDGVIHNGFRFDIDHRQSTAAGLSGALRAYYANVNSLEFKRAEVIGVSSPFTWDHSIAGASVGAVGGSVNRDITITEIEFSNMPAPIHAGRNDGLIIEKCKFFNIQSFGGNDHSDVIYLHMEATGPRNVHIRYNEGWNWFSEGFYIAADTMSPAIRADNIFFYGNVLRDINGEGSKCISLDPRAGTIANIQVINNTFVRCGTTIRVGGSRITGSANNNIFFSSGAPGLGGPGNLFVDGSSDPFIDLALNNYHIKGSIGSSFPRDRGAALGQEFSLDMDGKRRGSDGFWDIGAYEFKSGVIDPPVIAPPGNLRIVP